MRIAIIGGGAAGFAAAIAAAEQGAKVTVLERNTKPLKKLGVTGNGRGNILNAGDPIYYGDAAFANAVLGRVGLAELKRFFLMLGVPLRQEGEGRLYPAALQASVVQDALLLRAKQLGIHVQCLTRIERILPGEGQFILEGCLMNPDKGTALPPESYTLPADKVIVACGGSAAPAHGTDGSAYGLLTSLGHRCTPLTPALCALKVPKKRIQGLQGQRVRARLHLTDVRGKTVHQSRGEVLFAQDAVSGIAAMQLARFAGEGMQLHLDLRDELHIETNLREWLRPLLALRAGLPVADLFTGAFTKPVSRWILREAGMRDLQIPIAKIDPALERRILETVGDICLPVLCTRGFAYAQVTAGGIDTADVNPKTMESRLVPGLYTAGEILNVDGDCGGFNLMFAFAGGIIAGRAAGGHM